MELVSNVGALVLEWRNQHGLSQGEVCERINEVAGCKVLSQPTLSMMERGTGRTTRLYLDELPYIMAVCDNVRTDNVMRWVKVEDTND